MSLFLSLSFSFFCLRLCFSFRRCPRICLCLCLSLCPSPCCFQCLCFSLSLTCYSRSSLVSLCQSLSLSLSLSCFLSHLLLPILLGQPHRLLRTIRALVEDLHLLQDSRLSTFTFSTLDWMVGQHWDRIVCIGMFILVFPK